MKKTVSNISFLRLETPTNHMVIGSFCPLDRTPNMERIQFEVNAAVEHFPKMRMRLKNVTEDAWTEDAGFSLKRHLSYQHLPDIRQHSDIVEYVNRHFETRLDFNHSLWRIVVFSNRAQTGAAGPSYPDVAGIFFMIHHIMLDALGGFEIIEYMSAAGSGKLEAEPGSSTTPALKKRRAGRSTPRLLVFWRCAKKMIADMCARPVSSPINGINSSAKRLTTLDIPRHPLRQIKQQSGASVPDVLVALTAGMMRRYHELKGAPLKDIKVILPVSTRHEQDFNTLENAHTSFAMALPISIADPRQRLSHISKSIATMKANGAMEVNVILSRLTESFPHKLRDQVLTTYCKSTNLVCTIVPWKSRPISIGGAQILKNYGLVSHLRFHGLAIAFVIYLDTICVSLITDPQIIPDAVPLADYFQASLKELQLAYGA